MGREQTFVENSVNMCQDQQQPCEVGIFSFYRLWPANMETKLKLFKTTKNAGYGHL